MRLRGLLRPALALIGIPAEVIPEPDEAEVEKAGKGGFDDQRTRNALLDLHELCEELDIELPKGRYASLAGFLLEKIVEPQPVEDGDGPERRGPGTRAAGAARHDRPRPGHARPVDLSELAAEPASRSHPRESGDRGRALPGAGRA